MAPTVPTIEPESFVANTRLRFDIDLSEYPASSWTLSYYLHPTTGTVITFTSSASGDTHQVDVAASTTNEWAAGDYRWLAIADDGSADRREVRNGFMEILADPSDGSAVDYRTHDEKVLEALRTLLEGKALAGDQLSYSIANRQLSRMSPDEVWEWFTRYEARVNQQRQKERRAKGKTGGPHRVQTRFTS